MKDNVNHPDHYQNIAGVEAIDILNDVVKDLPGEQAAMLWNSMKYLFRFQNKNGVEDLKKARNYLDYLIADIEATNEAAKNIMAKSSAPKKEAPKPADTTYGPCVIYHSKVSGKVEVHYSMQMYAGTCTTLVFTSELARDMFISSFLNKLGKKRFSIRDVLNDTNFVVPSMADTFIVKMPWRDLFAKFRMRSKDGKYLLDFVYKHETYESLIKQPANDEHILYKSTVWGSADVYYSTDMPQGTCTKILFDDEGGRNVFALKFFRYLGYGSHGFSIQDILEDAKYMFPKEDNSLHFNMPWNDIFKGFHMTDEGGKYALEFIIDLQGGK